MFLGWPSNLRSLWECNWAHNLNNQLINKILLENFADIDLSERNIEELLCLAISALQAFVQENFVGPPLDGEEHFKELTWHSTVQSIGVEAIRNYLVSDGEEININVKYPELLAIAKYLLLYLNVNSENSSESDEFFLCQHWLLRYYGVHQLVLNENTESLFNGIKITSENLVESMKNVLNIDKDSKVICLLEISAWQLHYKRIVAAREKLQMAQQMLDVNITIEGKMGVRTKYQVNAVPQLMLRLDSPNGDIVEVPPIESPVALVKLPALLQLDDDTRLERIRFLNEEDNIITRTKSVVQALILAT